MKSIAIFASGSGTNAENIARYFKDSSVIRISVIISNKPDANVLERAKKLGIPSEILTGADIKDEARVMALLRHYEVDFIVLAGCLLRIPEYMVKAFPHAIVNIHPALLPLHGGKGMYGDRVHEDVIRYGEHESGITIHYVNEHYDSGAVIFQARCPVLSTDTPHDLATRVHTLEYAHYPRVIAETIAKL